METAAEAECDLARMAFDSGDARGVDSHVARAVELVRGRPPSAAHALALSQASRFQMLGGELAAAVESGREAERMATTLGLDGIRADALATVGTARAALGDSQGDADLRSAIALAEAANAPEALFRALNNLAWEYTRVDLRQAYELTHRQHDAARRYGHVRQIWWARTQLASTAYGIGRWDEALEHAEASIAYVETGNPLYNESQCRLLRAGIMLSRGQLSTLDAEIDRSLKLAAAATDPQATGPVVADAAVLRLWAGDRVRARQLLSSSLETARTSESGVLLVDYEAAFLAALLDLDPAELALPSKTDTGTPRERATAALLEGDLLGAADVLAELGNRKDEAFLRLRAGERALIQGHADEGHAQMERALSFYRGVRATRFIAEAERILSDTRQQSA